jgi:hypothetical protein
VNKIRQMIREIICESRILRVKISEFVTFHMDPSCYTINRKNLIENMAHQAGNLEGPLSFK